MTRSIPVLTLFALMFCVPCLCGQTEPSAGAIEGRVINEEGIGIKEATVYAVAAEDIRSRITTKSGAGGAFSMTGLPAGNFYLHAYKESAGYPDDLFAFFNTNIGSPVKVPVAAGQTTFDVRIQLGPPAGYLRLSIRNDQDAPVAAQLEFTRIDLGIRGTYKTAVAAEPKVTIMVPPRAFRLTIEADGYAPWHYGGDLWQEDAGLISLKSGEHLDLTVQLKRR